MHANSGRRALGIHMLFPSRHGLANNVILCIFGVLSTHPRPRGVEGSNPQKILFFGTRTYLHSKAGSA